jgi:hypothetical protein
MATGTSIVVVLLPPIGLAAALEYYRNLTNIVIYASDDLNVPK